MTIHTLPLYMSAVVLIASFIEAGVLARKRPGTYDWNEARLSLIDMAGRRLLGLLPISFAAVFFGWVWQHRIHTVSTYGPLTFLLVFVGQEFFYYWYHRASHRVRFFWATHSVHHSPNTLTLATAYRLGWTSKLTGTILFFTPLVWVGVKPEVVFAVLSMNLLYQFWLHATWIPKLGWFEGIFNTPSAHRVHHASNTEYLDVNYGGVLIVFDRLFGTYQPERDDLPCRYGLTTPLYTSNPLVVEFHQWGALIHDVMHAGSLGAAMSYILRPPGWSHDGQGETTEELRERASRPVAIDLG